jgi:hypothetical protein
VGIADPNAHIKHIASRTTILAFTNLRNGMHLFYLIGIAKSKENKPAKNNDSGCILQYKRNKLGFYSFL